MSDPLPDVAANAKHAADAVAGVTVLATLIEWLPPLASLMAILWYALQMYAWFKDRNAD